MQRSEMISESQEHLLKSITVQIKVEIKGEEYPLLGTGVICYREDCEYSIIITAKHCILGTKFQYPLSQLATLTIQYKYFIGDELIYLNIPIEQVLIGDEEKDIAIIFISNDELRKIFGEREIPKAEVSSKFKNLYYNSNGYPKVFSHNNAYHLINSKYASDQGTYFETKSDSTLSPGTGENAIHMIQGYSGAGVFIRNINYLVGIVTELKSTNGQFDTLNCLKIDDLNNLLKDNQFGVSDFNYVYLQNFEDVTTDQKLKAIDQALSTDITTLKNKLPSKIDITFGEERILNTLPLVGDKFSKRKALIDDFSKTLENVTWVHFFGSIGLGKTQLANLFVRKNQNAPIWIRLRDIKNPVETIKKQLSSVLEFPNEAGDWFKYFEEKINSRSTIILDDLPKLHVYEKAIGFFKFLQDTCSRNEIKIISTSNHKINSRIREHLNEAQFAEKQTPPLALEEISEILILHEAPPEMIEKYSKIIELQSKGHPFIVNEIALFLKSKEWKCTKDDLGRVFNYDFSVEFTQSIQFDLISSVQDIDARNLLYRLTQVKSSFSIEEVKVVANVKPQIQNPLEKLLHLQDLWIQQDSDSSLALSPLMDQIKSMNLSSELVIATNYSLGKSILEKKKFNQYEALKAINYFITAEAFNEAAFILILLLQEVDSNPDSFHDFLIFLLWYYREIPTVVDINSRIYIRILQIKIAIEIKENADILFLLTDLEKLVDEATSLGLEAGHAKLMLSLLYGKHDTKKANKYLLSGLKEYKTSSLDLPQELLPDSKTIIWVPLFYVSSIYGIIDWLTTFSKLELDERDHAVSINERIIPIVQAFTSIYNNEVVSQTKEQKLGEIIQNLDQVCSFAEKLNLPLVYVYSVRIKCWIKSIHLSQPQEAITIIEEALKKFKDNNDARYVLLDALARGLYDSGNKEEAAIFFEKAVEIDVYLISFEKIDLLNFLSNISHTKSPKISLSYSQKAYQITTNNENIDVITRVITIGEYAINQWYNDLKKIALYTLEKGYELLLKSNDESDAWKVTLMRYGHTFRYFSSYILKGKYPEKDINGDPFKPPIKGDFMSDFKSEKIDKHYFNERRFISSYIVLSCFESLGDLPLALKWSDYLFHETKIREPQYFQLMRISLSPYFIFKGELISALRNCYQAWEFPNKVSSKKLIESAPLPFLAEGVKNRPPTGNGQFIGLALSSVILPVIFKSLNEYLNGENIIDKFIIEIKEWSRNEDDNWEPLIDLLSIAAQDLTDYQRIHEYTNSYDGEYKELILIIGYLLSSIHAPTVEAFHFHYNLFPNLEKMLWSFASGSIPFLVIPFFEKFWEQRFEKNSSEFGDRDFWLKKSSPRYKNAIMSKRLRYLIQVLSHHLDIDLPSKQEDWIDNDDI